MGFGILLIGYFLAFVTSFAHIYFFADVIGGAVMVYALYKLSAYSDKFAKTLPNAMLFTFISAIYAIMSMFHASGSVMLIINSARIIAIFFFHVYMLTSLEDMAKGADDSKLAARTKRNLWLISVYYVLNFFVNFLGTYIKSTPIAYLSVIIYLYGIVSVLMNVWLLHSAYCRLYIEGTQERFSAMPQFKESKIGFIRNIQQKYYNSQKKAFAENYKLMQETKELAEEKKKNRAKKKKR